jgi:uncharacterized protein (TIGR04255 family)
VTTPGPNLPRVEHERFANPPLKAMFGQVRFPPILKVGDLSTVADFQEAIRSEFPEFAEEQQVSLVVGVGGIDQPAQAYRSYRFSTSDGMWSVALTRDSLTLEAGPGEYSSYDAFRKHFVRVWRAAAEILRPTRITRQGLRYIDHIEGDFPAQDWARLINPELLGGIAGNTLSQELNYAITDMRFTHDETFLFFKHGIVQAGPEGKSGYLLDFDCFDQTHVEELSHEPLMDKFDEFHEFLYAFFRWCITDQALEGFRGTS